MKLLIHDLIMERQPYLAGITETWLEEKGNISLSSIWSPVLRSRISHGSMAVGGVVTLGSKLVRATEERYLATWEQEAHPCPPAPHVAAPAASKPSNAPWSSRHWHSWQCWRVRVTRTGGLPALPPWSSDAPASSFSLSSSGNCCGCPPSYLAGCS